jgi:hypothetical protein
MECTDLQCFFVHATIVSVFHQLSWNTYVHMMTIYKTVLSLHALISLCEVDKLAAAQHSRVHSMVAAAATSATATREITRALMRT